MTDDTNVAVMPMRGFVIGRQHCRQPGDDLRLICLLDHGHDGEHRFVPWEGCLIRVPFGEGTVPFHGFANG